MTPGPFGRLTLLRAQPLPRHQPLGPQRSGPAVPPDPPPPPHRTFGDPQVAGDLINLVAAGEPLACLQRSRSRRCCSAGVHPPRCAYRMPRSYAAADVTT
jgi:hypothetical protein